MLNVLLIDGWKAGEIVAVESLRPIDVMRYNQGVIEHQRYHVKTFGKAESTDQFVWSFPCWPYVQWSYSDLSWASPLCKPAPIEKISEYFIGSMFPGTPDTSHVKTAIDILPPQVSYASLAPYGYVLARDWKSVFSV